jgi:hypothetical protein
LVLYCAAGKVHVNERGLKFVGRQIHVYELLLENVITLKEDTNLPSERGNPMSAGVNRRMNKNKRQGPFARP